MKQTFLGLALMAAITFGFADNTIAQDNQNRSERHAVMQTRQLERLEKELKLSDEQKAKFEDVYKRYSQELFALNPSRERSVDGETGASEQQRNRKDKKEMTDAEATARVQQIFDRQAEQIQRSQMRLDIQKKYCAEFSAFLTPQQLVKVLESAQMRNRDGRQGNRGNRGGRDDWDGQRGGQRGGMGGPRGGFGGPGGGPGGDF